MAAGLHKQKFESFVQLKFYLYMSVTEARVAQSVERYLTVQGSSPCSGEISFRSIFQFVLWQRCTLVAEVQNIFYEITFVCPYLAKKTYLIIHLCVRNLIYVI